MAQLSDWSKFDEIRKSQAIKGSRFQAVVRSQKGNICHDVRSGQRSLESGNERQKVRIIGRRSSLTDTWLLAGIADDVSFGAGFRLARIECFAGDSESRRHFNQVRQVFSAK